MSKDQWIKDRENIFQLFIDEEIDFIEAINRLMDLGQDLEDASKDMREVRKEFLDY